MRFVWIGLVSFALLGCGARTTLSVGDDAGASAPDAGRDGGRDAGRRDAGRDAGAFVPCERDLDCRGDVCRAFEGLAPRDLEPMPLSCGAPTMGTPLGGACHRREECDRGLCAVAGVCVRPCARDTDCDTGEACREVYVQTAVRALQPLTACTARVAAPDDVRVAGPEPLPMISGEDDPITDTVADLAPDGMVVWRGEAGTMPFLHLVRAAPAGAVLADPFAFDPTGPAPDWGVSPVALGDLVTLLYPNGPRTPLTPGGLDVELVAALPTTAERWVVQRGGEGAILDLDIYLAGGHGWTSPDGTAPPSLTPVLRDLREILGGAGLTLGEVRYHEIVGQLRQRFAVLDGRAPPFDAPPDLDDLYRMSAGANRPSVHVFFVRSIEGALGIASGIPGPHVHPGTGASGVAIAVDMVPLTELGVVMGHEIGHFMGMFHTSEADGSVADPFDDSPECRADRDLDNDGFLIPSECVGQGAEHMMFWAGSGPLISEQQGELMRRAYFTR